MENALQQLIDYHANMVALEKQGAPLDWRKVSDNIVSALSTEKAKLEAASNAEVKE